MTELTIGDKAPEFKLPTDGDGVVNLTEFKGKKNVILYFYPKDDTPGCTIEAKDFKELNDDFANKDTIILGVSKDSVQKHDKFKEKYDLPFSLISDEALDMCQKYGVWVEKSMFGRKYMGINRSTFLIDKSGKIQKIWRNVKVTNHAQEVFESVA